VDVGETDHPLGPILGRIHAWRDRGSMYVEGVRTSVQAGILTAGVAKGAAFTGTRWAVALGVGMVVGLEAAKLLAGWLDYRLHVIHHQQRILNEANPVLMRMVDALEKTAPK
jgi:hypothetical protein